MSAVEKYKSRKLEGDGVKNRGSRTFIVTVADTSVNPIEDIQLPAYRSTWPGWVTSPLLILDRKSVETVLNDLTFEVTCLYSTQGLYIFPQKPNDNAAGFNALQDTWTMTEVNIPTLFQQQVKYFDPVTHVQQLKYEWIRDDFKISVPSEAAQYRMTLTTYGPTERAYVLSQMGKFHNLAQGATSLFLYTGAEVSQREQNLWDVTHSWVGDSGNRAFNTLDTSAFVSAPARLPFQRYVVHPALGDSISDAPTVTAQNSYVQTDITGYAGAHGLPGAPV